MPDGAAQQIEAIGVSGHSLGVVPVDGRGDLLGESVPIWSTDPSYASGSGVYDLRRRAYSDVLLDASGIPNRTVRIRIVDLLRRVLGRLGGFADLW